MQFKEVELNLKKPSSNILLNYKKLLWSEKDVS